MNIYEKSEEAAKKEIVPDNVDSDSDDDPIFGKKKKKQTKTGA